MINLADYIASDYPKAIENGIVLNEFEYSEMQEFAQKLIETHEDASREYDKSNFLALASDLLLLQEQILNKADGPSIKVLASKISKSLLDEGVLSNIPSTYPKISNGKLLYAAHCARCHGAVGAGDGPSAVDLNPMPANLMESDHLFPFHVYNTILLGIEGTAMLPVSQLTEEETWDLAFYVMTLAYSDNQVNADLYESSSEVVDLNLLSNSTNQSLVALFDVNGEAKVKALRFHESNLSQDESLTFTLGMLQESINLYKAGKMDEANQKALDAYFIGFEPVERELGATNPGMVTTIEKEMMIFRSYLNGEGNDALIQEQFDKIAYHFESIENEKDQGGFWFVFLASISILLREGLEALLIIVAILAALNTFDEGQKAKIYVHAGWLSALLLGMVSYMFANKLIAMGSHSRELIEGFGALLAVLILLSVGFWLHDKSNAMSWSKYVKGKLSKHLSTNSLWSVALLAFIVVFREAFESVVFLSSLSMSKSADSGMAVLSGTIFSTIVIILIGLLMIKFSKKLPIHQVFKISSITMVVLAVVLAGRGIKELQEAAFINVHLLPFHFSLDLLGFYPTLQTIAAQLITFLLAMSLWYYNNKKQSEV